MELYKLIEGKLIQAPTNLEWVDSEGALHCETPAQEDTLLAYGWKPKESTEKPTIKWFEQLQPIYSENETTIFEDWNIEPLPNLRQLYTNHFNSICDNQILTGLYFKGMNLWLTTETQTNLSTDFLASALFPELAVYPKIYNFDGTLHFLTDFSELAELFNAAKDWKNQCLTECWNNKALNITDDLELYNYVKAL